MANSEASASHSSGGRPAGKYQWFSPGDINGFFGLIIDNMAVMSIMAGILIGGFKFPADIVFHKMFPGTALGVLFGDLVYTWMAFRLAKKTGNPTVTAMPLGLDTPSSIGIALAVLAPAFIGFKGKGMNELDAGMATWYLGMATMILIGGIKLIFSFVGPWVQRIVPQAGLLGSLAGIGLALIGFIPLIEIFQAPVVGLIALGLVFYTLVAGIRLPKNFPGMLAAVIVGTALYYILAPAGLLGIEFKKPAADLYLALPVPTLGFTQQFRAALGYFPIAFPFAILTVIGGINVTESARVAGDDFNTRSILLTEAVATLLAGITGGVAQSTPYIGQPAYKAMGSRAGYTLLTGLFIGLAGFTGLIGFVYNAIPAAVMAPILVFVGLDIISQSFHACPKKHAAAVAFAFLPTVARMLSIKYGSFIDQAAMDGLLNKAGATLPEMMVTNAIGNGFILTGMLWGAFLVKIIDRKLVGASGYLFICAALTFFGVIHSADARGNMYLPWDLTGMARTVAFQFTLAYVILAVMMLLLSFTRGSREPAPEHLHA